VRSCFCSNILVRIILSHSVHGLIVLQCTYYLAKHPIKMNESLENLTKRISSLIPGEVKNLQEDFENNVRSLLQSSLTKMNLVTREEFDVQSAVLQRTREKLEQLEKQVDKLK
jgi:BMFP domain-containing protein YqiC